MISYEKTYLAKEPQEYGKNIYIIGESLTGPIGEPIFISDVDKAIEIFGDYNNSSLTKSYIQFNKSNGTGAYLVKINGKEAKAVLYGVHNNQLMKVIEFVSNNAGTLYNSMYILINSGILNIIYIDNGVNKSKQFLLNDYVNIGELANAINISIGHVINAFALEDKCSTITIGENNNSIVNFSNGDDEIGLSKNELYYKSKTILDLLIGKPIDIITLSNMYFDDIIPNYYDGSETYGGLYYIDDRDYLDVQDNGEQAGFHKILINFCLQQSYLGIMSHAIMGFNELQEEIDTVISGPKMVVEATALGTYDGIRDINNDYGMYISLCYGDIDYNFNEEYKRDNFYLSYAANWINSETTDSMTGTSFEIDGEFVQNFSKITLKELSNMGIITYKYSPLKNWCTTSGTTLAKKTSGMLYSANFKIVQKTINELNKDINKFIYSNSSPVLTGEYLSRVIDTSLAKRRDNDNIIKSYNYIISYDEINKIIKIEVDLVAIYTLEKIRATTEIGIGGVT